MFLYNDRTKFGSQISDNTDRWKSRAGKSQKRESEKEEDPRKARVRRKKMQVRETSSVQSSVLFELYFIYSLILSFLCLLAFVQSFCHVR